MKNEPSVHIVTNAHWGGANVMAMFKEKGFRPFIPILAKDQPDLVVFLGGEDVNPKLYGEEILRGTTINVTRDRDEQRVFEKFAKVPKVGICRGGQFLNVMSGGAMWQHVDNHTSDHTLVDLLWGTYPKVTSTHHQMMIPGKGGEELAVAFEAKDWRSGTQRERPDHDTEVVFYGHTNSLCFQPHPEYSPGETRDYFFRLLKHIWNYGPDIKEEEPPKKDGIDVC